jgi:hypothetical protein
MSTSTRKIKYHLDQNEILQHLEHLGYKDISQEQLKDFTKGKSHSHVYVQNLQCKCVAYLDLKRLIKYDVVKNKGPSSSAGSEVNSQLAFSYNSDGQLSTRTASSLESSRSGAVFTKFML